MKAPYLLDCYTKEFDAKVIKVKDGVFIILDQTYFYPTSGGQPYDMGTITSNGSTYKVVFAKKEEDGGRLEGVLQSFFCIQSPSSLVQTLHPLPTTPKKCQKKTTDRS